MRRSISGGRFGRKTRFFGMALVVVVGIAAMGWLVMLLWNWLMPTLFTGAGQIDYWRALGLLLLSKVLFGGGGGTTKAADGSVQPAPGGRVTGTFSVPNRSQ